jgi:hypothetical protein
VAADAPNVLQGTPQAAVPSQDVHEDDLIYKAIIAALKSDVVLRGVNFSDVELAQRAQAAAKVLYPTRLPDTP